MKRKTRFRYSEADKALLWDSWQKGDSMNEIAHHFGRYHSAIQRVLSQNGGVRPALRKRSRLALTLSEREEISRGLVAGCSLRSIAEQLGRSPSTISREIHRNRHRRGYRASRADQAAWDRSCRPKRCKLVESHVLARMVATKLQALWSPEDRRLVKTHLSGRRELSGVTRDHLSQPLYPGPRCLEKGAIRASAQATDDAAIAAHHS